MKEPIIRVEDLRVIYNEGKSNEVRALKSVSVDIYPNEYIIIFGPSGCGKSTLLYSISGLQPPTYGTVMVDGMEISSDMKKKDKVKLHQTVIGMIFQAFYVIPSLKIIDNVCLPKAFMGVRRKDRLGEGMELLRRFGIAEQAHKFPSELSGGQSQRVAIARSLINNPGIILADEPVGNLDSESAQNVLAILKELNEVDKKTVIMVTHNPEHLRYADRIFHMKDGELVNIEINKDKRPVEAIKKELTEKPEEVTDEMKVLMRTFKNLSPQQLGVLLVPFKAKQLMSHVLSQLTEEQYTSAENYLKELLFKNIDVYKFEKSLDMEFEDGGAGWNKIRAHSFSRRIKLILDQVRFLSQDAEKGLLSLADYLADFYGVDMDLESKLRFRAFIKMRVENRIDGAGLQMRLDANRKLGGVGLNRQTAEKIAREMEVVMLLKFSM